MSWHGCNKGDPNCQHEYGEEEYTTSPPLKHCIKCKGCTANYPNHPHTWTYEPLSIQRSSILILPPIRREKRTCYVCGVEEIVEQRTR